MDIDTVKVAKFIEVKVRNREQPNKVERLELVSTRKRNDLNGAYFRMGLVVGLTIAVLGIYITYLIMA